MIEKIDDFSCKSKGWYLLIGKLKAIKNTMKFSLLLSFHIYPTPTPNLELSLTI